MTKECTEVLELQSFAGACSQIQEILSHKIRNFWSICGHLLLKEASHPFLGLGGSHAGQDNVGDLMSVKEYQPVTTSLIQTHIFLGLYNYHVRPRKTFIYFF